MTNDVSGVLFRNGKVYVGGAVEARDGLEVLIEGDRVKEVSDTPIKASRAQVIDLNGRTLMPGLIDAHFHANSADASFARVEDMPSSLIAQHARGHLEGSLQRGLTTIRDAGGADYGLAYAIESGLIRGPRLFYSGRALSQTGGHGDVRSFEASPVTSLCSCGLGARVFSRIVDGVPAVREAARDELRKGATQIKIMASGGVASPSDPIWVLQFSEEEIRAAVWEAHSWRTYVMAHAYTPEAIRRAIEYGVRSIEHGNLIDAETAQFAAREDAFVVPTLATYEALATHGKAMGFPQVSLDKLGDVREAGIAALEVLKAAGVKVGFGTDLLGPMHALQLSEFAIRARVLGPLEIMEQVTTLNAELLNRSGELGVIAPGALADAIVVDGDPTRDLSVFEGDGERVALVMKGGDIMRNEL